MLFCAILTSIVFAAKNTEPKNIGNYGAWRAFEFLQKGHKVCYIMAKPVVPKGSNLAIMITHRPKQKVFNEINISLGSKINSALFLELSNKKFSLLVNNHSAWSKNNSEDGKIVKLMLTSKKLSVKGKKVAHIYSLNGFNMAYKRIQKACNIR